MKERNYYTKERCTQLALECKSRSEFRSKHNSAYQRAYKKKWLDEICSHMLPLNDKKFRDIYVIRSKCDKYIYVGLSCNVQKRYNHHVSKPTKKVKELLSIPHELEILETHLLTESAIKKEQEYIDKFNSEGWVVLNSVKAGSIGNPYESKWDVNQIKELASSFTYRMDFYRAYPGVYDFLYEKKLLEEVCLHMKSRVKPRTIEINNESLTFTEASIKYNKARACIVKRWLSGKKDLDLIK